jgi:hypothetical protein
MMRTVLSAATAALAALLAMAPVAAATTTATARTGSGAAESFTPDTEFNSNQVWTGYVDVANNGVKFTYVATRFTVPRVTCTSANSKASFWVGIDGYGNKTVEQDGISTDCHDGEPVYNAWLELFPKGVDPIFRVFPGNTIIMSVSHNLKNGLYTFKLDDTSIPGATVHSFDLSGPCPHGSTCLAHDAEVILEANGGAQLSRFPKVTFTDSQVTSSKGTGAFKKASSWTLAEPLMTGKNGRPLATVSATSHNGADFSFIYDQP